MEYPLPTGEFSPRDELREIQVTGKIIDYDPEVHPNELTMFGFEWVDNSNKTQPYFLEEDGSFSFSWRANVVQEYFISAGGRYHYMLLKPGTQVKLEVQLTDGEANVTAPQDTFVNNSIRLLSVLQAPDTYDGLAPMERGADLDTYRASVVAWEQRMQARFDSAWAAQDQTDPYLHAWGNHFVTYRMKRNLLMFPIVAAEAGPARDSMYQVAIYPELPSKLEERPVVSSSYLDYAKMGSFLYKAEVRQKIMTSPKAERMFAGYRAEEAAIKENYTGLTAELMQAVSLDLYLRTPSLDRRVLAAAREFISTTEYPMLREPLVELVATLTETALDDTYARNVSELPEGIDNPIPAILAKHAGKVVVIDVWATWCGPCLQELEMAYPVTVDKYADREVAFVFLARSSQEPLWLKKVSEFKFTGDHYRTNATQDAVLNKLFGVSAVPHHIVFDRAGTLVQSNAPGPAYGLEDLIEELL